MSSEDVEMTDVSHWSTIVLPLSQKQISGYVQPTDTRACGTNCVICCLRMLNVLSAEQADAGTRSICTVLKNRPPRPDDELFPALKSIFPDKNFRAITPIGANIGLQETIKNLRPGFATPIAYGNAIGGGMHMALLRRGEYGAMEMIDPQRGLDDIDKPYGFTQQEAITLGMEVTPNFSRVRGIDAIITAMVIQSLRFQFFPNTEEAYRNMAVYWFEVSPPFRYASSRRLLSGPKRKSRRSSSLSKRGCTRRLRASRSGKAYCPTRVTGRKV